jgi:hypothetical protein
MRVIIAGSREFKDYELLKKVTLDILARLQYNLVVGSKDIEILSGMARGADLLGKKFGDEFKLKVIPFVAKWDDMTASKVFVKYREGKPYNVLAGTIRNEEMARYAAEDKDGHGVLIAFSTDTAKGTKDMIALAKKQNLMVFVVNGYDGKVVEGSI